MFRTLLVAALAATEMTTSLVRDSEMINVVDCDGHTYQVPLEGTDSSVVDKLLADSLSATDTNGMGEMILQMSAAKTYRLKSLAGKIEGDSPLANALRSIASSSNACATDVDNVHSDVIARDFGENIPVFEAGILEDEPAMVGNSGGGTVLRKQKRFDPARRMFHSDQADVDIKDILPGKEETLELYQGDMVYHKKFNEHGSTAGGSAGTPDTVYWSAWNLWPSSVVNWFVDTAAPVDECAISTFRTASSMLEKYTCLRFTEGVTPGNGVSSIKLTSDGNTCWAYVGMSSQSQVNLGGPGCQIPGIALHEVGHAVGLIHQQSRGDRDKYVTIEWDNVKNAAADNFKKIISGSSYDTVTATRPYDYSSIMHYSACEFSTTRYDSPCGRTIDPADASVVNQMGQREFLSPSDIITINSMYGCSATCGDGIQNQGEEGVDCGGPCRRICGNTTSDGIVPLPAQCMISSGRTLTTNEIYIIGGIGGLTLILIVVVFVNYLNNRRARKDQAKARLLAKTKMTPDQLRAAMRQRSQVQRANNPAMVAQASARRAAASSGGLTPSAPPAS